MCPTAVLNAVHWTRELIVALVKDSDHRYCCICVMNLGLKYWI